MFTWIKSTLNCGKVNSSCQRLTVPVISFSYMDSVFFSYVPYTLYHIAGKFGRENVWWIICDLPNQSHSKLYLHIINFRLIYSFAKRFCQTLRKSKFAKHSHHQTFCYTVYQLDGKSSFGIQVEVFSPYIGCAGKSLPPAVAASVAIISLLSSMSTILLHLLTSTSCIQYDTGT